MFVMETMRLPFLSFRFFFAILLPTVTLAVEKSNFKTCKESSFCRRQRNVPAGLFQYQVIAESVRVVGSTVDFTLVDTEDGVLKAKLSILEDDSVRLRVNENDPLYPRYEVNTSLANEPVLGSVESVEKLDNHVHIKFGDHLVVLSYQPFRVDIVSSDRFTASLNGRGLMNFEQYRRKEPLAGPLEKGKDTVTPVDDGLWEETFKTFTDSKPRGPSSVGLDLAFAGVDHVYGIPEHADSFSLKSTTGSGSHHHEPYRLYNLDVFEYELDNPMALYGSIPVMLAHSSKQTIGVFWNNAAETWVDISTGRTQEHVPESLMSYFDEKNSRQKEVHWFSESGIIDVFVMLGPQPHDVFRQYSALTGRPALPPMFAIGYHQSRWNYNDEDDVMIVNQGYEKNDIPVDVIWLDIEHTDSKKYFTWDVTRFPDPARMQEKLWQYGRRMVTIIDPHIKREDGYHIHEEAKKKELYVKCQNGSSYEGWCWPGSSSWIDFLNPDIQKWWSSQMLPENYKGSTLSLFTWNDMNEPSVFNGPEITMHKDAVHYGGVEHRDVHNIYGLLQHQATAEGLTLRSGNISRPFVLSRAFFAGSQRYGAIWTGDNTADWGHLKASIPMLLSIGVAGMPFCGADVGGFFKDPGVELLIRWYQAGAYQPFFRAHAHLDTRRREPHILDQNPRQVIRMAITERYEWLPYWYTCFWRSSHSGLPVMRPLWVEYPRDKKTFSVEDEFLIGKDLLVKPVTQAQVQTWPVYLPGKYQVWYDINSHSRYRGGQVIDVQIQIQKIPVFQRGGSILPKKYRVRRSTVPMVHDPFSLQVYLDGNMKASGELYSDDGTTFDYKRGQFLVRHFKFANGKLTSKNGNPSGVFETSSWLERVVVVGWKKRPNTVKVKCKGSNRELSFAYQADQQLIMIRKPDVNIQDDFTISIS